MTNMEQLRKYGSLLFIIGIGMMLCVYIVTNKVIVGICGVLVTGLFGWAFYEIRRSRNVSRGTKRSSWFFLIVIAAIIYITYAKLTGTWDPR